MSSRISLNETVHQIALGRRRGEEKVNRYEQTQSLAARRGAAGIQLRKNAETKPIV
jgi:hypothetical protein